MFVWTEHDVSLLKQTGRVFGTIPPGHLIEATNSSPLLVFCLPMFTLVFQNVSWYLVVLVGKVLYSNFQTWIRWYVVGRQRRQRQKFCMNPDIAQSPSLECFLFEDSRWYQLSHAGAEIFNDIYFLKVCHPSSQNHSWVVLLRAYVRTTSGYFSQSSFLVEFPKSATVCIDESACSTNNLNGRGKLLLKKLIVSW